ncbi:MULTISPECIES: hypothetical protein [unclassified Oceanobacter]|jgi:uncharacterized protein YacL|uniref:hypothetical protein n=1 Tax=unclassified Oceanobacter TaxID=2620260 RepID=UPI0026E236AC|nr:MULTISPECIES: hypothetical protein [unclassified Oceanobacter]MDO6682192.1 hypothetical protein [Oceanobacter sp. 5_MG-2023]MDP2504925.1 hypothetical protein [Oceanobacter sp. 3_MG-2023]MDP2546369.1 hypothetical protein [Oceanobacter sp. 4_MG-2023]MDP2610441.1 hypothetical protein [Oceanobacter sp. 1_MG-2023]MDP2613677.1 hypothetical protein [Oceanobacter sp. 2_MG-2023]
MLLGTRLFEYKTAVALLFSGIFHLIALLLVFLAVSDFFSGVGNPEIELITHVIKSINNLVIALAMYELGVGVGKEYTADEQGESVFVSVRRTISRFVGTVCIALVLEALIMIIKYSQLELAGNLYYPVAILVACSLLLASLGAFLALTRRVCEEDQSSCDQQHALANKKAAANVTASATADTAAVGNTTTGVAQPV